MVVSAIEPSLDLGLEHVNRTCARQPDDQRYAEDSCIEMPSPHCAIEPARLFVPARQMRLGIHIPLHFYKVDLEPGHEIGLDVSPLL
jgi:hypothetical protein